MSGNMVYTSIENKKIKELNKLKKKKYRDLSDTFLVEGEHLIREAEACGCLKELYLLEGTDFSTMVPVHYVSNTVMRYVSSLECVSSYLGVCFKNKQNSYGNRILVLEDIQDPGNLGTIIRSAVAFHVDTILLSKGCVDLYNDKVIRASQGMLFHISIFVCDLEEVLLELKKLGYTVFATKVDGGKSVKKLEKLEKFVIIMGNEGNGVSQRVLDQCDHFLYIDMSSSCESLNVAVATSIILYELDK